MQIVIWEIKGALVQEYYQEGRDTATLYNKVYNYAIHQSCREALETSTVQRPQNCPTGALIQQLHSYWLKPAPRGQLFSDLPASTQIGKGEPGGQ